MKIIQEPTAFEIISVFSSTPDFFDREIYSRWLRRAGLFLEADELETLSEHEFNDLFRYFTQIHKPQFIH